MKINFNFWRSTLSNQVMILLIATWCYLLYWLSSLTNKPAIGPQVILIFFLVCDVFIMLYELLMRSQTWVQIEGDRIVFNNCWVKLGWKNMTSIYTSLPLVYPRQEMAISDIRLIKHGWNIVSQGPGIIKFTNASGEGFGIGAFSFSHKDTKSLLQRLKEMNPKLEIEPKLLK